MAIFIVSCLMVVLPAVGLAVLAHRVFRRRRKLAALLGALLGAFAGMLWAISTYHESTWDPPIVIEAELPPRFSVDAIVLIEDPGASRTIAWTGVDVPFFSPEGRVSVPPSGIARVRSLEGIANREGRMVFGESAHRGREEDAYVQYVPGLGTGRIIVVPLVDGCPLGIVEERTELIALIRARERQ